MQDSVWAEYLGRARAVGCAPAAQSCAVETTPNTECKVVLGVVSVGLLV